MTSVALFLATLTLFGLASQSMSSEDTPVAIESDGWRLVGELRRPEGERPPVPAVVVLHGAARNRSAYIELARELAIRGSRLGDSTCGRMGKASTRAGSYPTTILQHSTSSRGPSGTSWPRFAISKVSTASIPRGLRSSARATAVSLSEKPVASTRKAAPYAVLSPGSLSDETIAEIDPSGIPWLYVRSRDERRVTEVTEAVQRSSHAEVWIVPGSAHGSDLVRGSSSLSEQIAVWLGAQLSP